MGGMDYEGAKALYQKLNIIIDEMKEIIIKHQKNISNLDSNDNWKGKAYDGYNENYFKFTQNFVSHCSDIDDAYKKILFAIIKFKAIDSKFMNSFKGE